MKEAMFYSLEDTDRVRCSLCRFRCLINDGSRGICNVRENHKGTLYSLVYGKICVEHVDPIEKSHSSTFCRGAAPIQLPPLGATFVAVIDYAPGQCCRLSFDLLQLYRTHNVL